MSATAAIIVTLFGQHLWAYALAVVASMLTCWLFNVGSAARLAGVTATIILLVPHKRSVAGMMMSRIAEVGWGVAVGIATVWLFNKIQKIAAARKRSAAI